jgi:hypothetical protein
VEIPAPVAEVPAPVAEIPADARDLQVVAKNLIANALNFAPIPAPAVGGAGTSNPVRKVKRPAIYDEMEDGELFYVDKKPDAPQSVSGVKRSFSEMSKPDHPDKIIRDTPEYKWIIKGYPLSILSVLEIEAITYKGESLFYLQKHRTRKCIYIGFRHQAFELIHRNYDLRKDVLRKAFHLYLQTIIENSNEAILNTISNDSQLSSFYGMGVLYRSNTAEYIDHSLFVWEGNKRYKFGY